MDKSELIGEKGSELPLRSPCCKGSLTNINNVTYDCAKCNRRFNWNPETLELTIASGPHLNHTSYCCGAPLMAYSGDVVK